MLSRHLPFPSILIVIPLSLRYSTQASQVNCEPWSEFTISGLPCLAIASRSTLWLFSESRELDSPQPTIYRLYTSMMAVKYMNPLNILTYVMSISQTWFDRVISKPLSLYECMYLAKPSLLRFRLG